MSYALVNSFRRVNNHSHSFTFYCLRVALKKSLKNVTIANEYDLVEYGVVVYYKRFCKNFRARVNAISQAFRCSRFIPMNGRSTVFKYFVRQLCVKSATINLFKVLLTIN